LNKDLYYKWLFIIGAFFNWINAITFLILSILEPNIFSLFGSSYPPTLLFLHALLLLIFTYGIGYFIVGLDITKNHGIVILGIISKLAFFFCCLTYFLLGDVNFIIVGLAFGDFIFACLFFEFFIYTKNKKI